MGRALVTRRRRWVFGRRPLRFVPQRRLDEFQLTHGPIAVVNIDPFNDLRGEVLQFQAGRAVDPYGQNSGVPFAPPAAEPLRRRASRQFRAHDVVPMLKDVGLCEAEFPINGFCDL